MSLSNTSHLPFPIQFVRLHSAQRLQWFHQPSGRLSLLRHSPQAPRSSFSPDLAPSLVPASDQDQNRPPAPPFAFLFPSLNRFGTRIQIEASVNLPRCIYSFMSIALASTGVARDPRPPAPACDRLASLFFFYCYRFRFAVPHL